MSLPPVIILLVLLHVAILIFYLALTLFPIYSRTKILALIQSLVLSKYAFSLQPIIRSTFNNKYKKLNTW